MKKSYSPVKTIQKAFRLLEYLGEHQPAAPLELARELKLTRSNVHRFLATLEELGYVDRDPDSGYSLTFKAFRLGSTVLKKHRLPDIARTFMARLAEISQENVNLAVISDHRVLYLEKIESPHYLKLDQAIGGTDPIYCTALGKALLSGLSNEKLADFLKDIEMLSCTKKTITDPKALIKEIRKVSQQGYATDFEELSEGIHCIAVPVYDHTRNVNAAISVSGPAVRLTKGKIRALKALMIETSMEISKKLGFTNERR